MTKRKKNYNPDYIRARKKILECIADEKLQIGDRLPSLNKLVNKYPIGRFSFQSAIKSLITEGYLKSVRGSGVYINEIENNDDIGDHFSSMESSSFSFSVADKIELKLAYGETAPFQVPIINEIIDAFQKKNNNISIKIVPSPNHNQFFSHNPDRPDIFTTVQHSLAVLRKQDILFDISFYLDSDQYQQSKDFPPELFSGCFWGKEMVAIPAYLGIPLIIIDSKSYEQRVSEAIPKSWDFAEYNRLHSEFIPKGKLNYYSCSSVGLEFFVGNQILELWDSKKRQFSENTDDYQEIVEILSIMLKNRNHKYHCIGQKHNSTNPLKLMSDGGCVMAEGYNTALNGLQNKDNKYTVLQYPELKKTHLQPMAEYLSVGRWSAYPLECTEFLKFFLSEESQSIFAKHNRISLRHSVNEKYYKPPSWQNPEWQKQLSKKPVRSLCKDQLLRQCMNSVIARELLLSLKKGYYNKDSIKTWVINIIKHGNHFADNFELSAHTKEKAIYKRKNKKGEKYHALV